MYKIAAAAFRQDQRRLSSVIRMFQISELIEHGAADITALVTVWERSVRATHLFSSEGEILRIRRLIPDALRSVHHLLVARDVAGDAAGFIGIDGREIAMLFLAPEMRGKGLGRRLVQCATDRFSANEVTANKQNPQALDFYRNMGFCA